MRTLASMMATLLLLCLAGAALAQPPLPPELNDIPRYSGAVVVATMDAGATKNATFQANGSINEVADFFNAKLAGMGWAKAMEARQQDGAMLSFTKGGKSLTVGVSPDDDGKVSYTLIYQ